LHDIELHVVESDASSRARDLSRSEWSPP
jgi:hypothetical protein